MYSTCRLFKHTYFMLLRNLQNTNQSYIKCTENALIIYNDNNNNITAVIIIAVSNSDSNLRIKKKFSFK